MKKIVIAAFVNFITFSLFSQTDSVTVFDDVILIDTKNVATNGFDYILDIPLRSEPKSDIIIFNRDEKLANKLFFQLDFLYHFNTVKVISPDWEYYKSLAKNKNAEEPIAVFKLYTVKMHSQNSISIDSTSYYGNLPKINYRKSDKAPENQILIYHVERFGSICCPPDPRLFSPLKKITGYNNEAEKTSLNKSKIYTRMTGYEGEHQKYYTLELFTPLERLDFINELISDRNQNIKRDTPTLFYPYFVSNLGLEELGQKMNKK